MTQPALVRRTLRSALVLAATGSLLLAACGGDDAATERPAAEGGASTCMTQAQAIVDKAQAPIEPPSPGEPFDMSRAKGKSVWLILPVVNPATSPVAEGFKEAAAYSGVKGRVFEGKGTTTSWNSGVAQAAAQGADVIILYGIDVSLVQTPLKQAVAQGAKVIDAFTTDPDDPLARGVYAHVTPDNTADGRIAAAQLLTATDCKANVGIYFAPTFAIHKKLKDGAVAELDRLCPTCKAYPAEVDIATVATSVTPQVATQLRRNPDINAVFPVFDAIVPFVTSALEQVRPDVPMVSHDGVPAQLSMVRAGNTPLIGDIAFPPGQWIGWTFVDTAARAVLGLEPGNTRLVTRLITKENAGEKDASLWPGFEDLESIFGPAWGRTASE